MKKKNNNDVEFEIQNPFAKPKNIQIGEDKEKKIAILKIYGDILEPEEYIEELTKLEFLSKTHDVIEITLNSPGGSLNTTVDLASIISNFNYVITIGKGEIASAAFMLWTMGNIRVVTDYSMYMAHRESYGMYGKTSEHRDAAKTFGMVYEELFEKCFGDLLTHDEKLIAERSEAWISYSDLLERDKVISLDQYLDPPSPYSSMELFITDDSKSFLFDTDSGVFRSVNLTYGDEYVDDMTEYFYGITNINKVPEKPKKAIKKKKPKKTIKKKNPKKVTKKKVKKKNVKSKDDKTKNEDAK